MAHGKLINLAEAKANIRKFVDDEMKRTKKKEKEIIVGHRVSLATMKSLMKKIEKLKAKKIPIDSIRVYYAKSTRSTVIDDYDIVIVPVKKNGEDYYHVYDRPSAIPGVNQAMMAATDEDGTALGSSTPCPNVCN